MWGLIVVIIMVLCSWKEKPYFILVKPISQKLSLSHENSLPHLKSSPLKKVLRAEGVVGPKLAARMLREYSGAKHPEPTKYFPTMDSTKPRVAKLGKFSKQPKFPRSLKSESAPQIGQYEVQSALDFMDPFLPGGGKHLLSQVEIFWEFKLFSGFEITSLVHHVLVSRLAF